MKLFIALTLFVGSYAYVLVHTTDTVLSQAQHINQAYQYVASHSDQLATGR